MNPLAFLFAPRRVVAGIGVLGALLLGGISPAKAQNIATVAGSGTNGFSGDNGQATSAALRQPYGVAVDGAGNIFIGDFNNSRVRKVAINGIITTVAGNGSTTYNGDNIQATSAGINRPVGVATDKNENLYLTDFNNRIRKVAPNGIITTVVGNGTAGFSGDGGRAINAQFNGAYNIYVDGDGNLFFPDYGNHRIRKVDTNGFISTVAGNGSVTVSGDNGLAINAGIPGPLDIVFDGAGNLFIAGYGHNRIRKVAPNGIITTFAGNDNTVYNGDSIPATSATVSFPSSVDVDGAGNVFIVDTGHHRIRKVNKSGIITTVAGTGTAGFSGDGAAANTAQINNPTGVALDSLGNLYLSDHNNLRVRKVNGVGTPQPTLSISDASVGEVNSGTTPLLFTVTRSGDTTNAVNFSYSTSDGTATAGSDYVAVAGGSGSIAAGAATTSINIMVNGDTGFEADETFNVTLSAPTNGATLSDATGVGTITNDDSAGAKGGVIAYASYRGSDFEIFVMNADGSNPTQLTDNSSSDYYPVISPDGSKIAFASDRDGNLELYVMNVNGSGQMRLTNNAGADYAPDWSPDSSRILFTSGTSSRMAIINADGTGLTTLAIGGWEPAWSPDGAKIVYEGPNTSRLFTGNIDGSNVTALPASPGASSSTRETAPEWSPDGTRIGFASNEPGVASIYSAAVGSATRQLMASTTHNQEGPSYSPSGARIVYLAPRGNASFPFNLEVCTRDVNNGAETRVTNDSFWDYQPSWGPGEVVPLPTLSIGDLSVVEGNGDVLREGAIAVSLSAPATGTITVKWSTTSGTATGDNDYASVTNPQTLTFNTGEQTKSLFVAIAGDTIVEPNETFFVNLSNPSGATIADGQSLVTIQDDDATNTPPVAVDDRITQAFVSNGNTTKSLLISAATLTANDTDAEGDTRTVTGVSITPNTFGTVTLSNGQITYEQNTGSPLKKLASFEYTVSDGRGGTDTGLVTVGEDQGLVVTTTTTNTTENEGKNTLRDAIEFANLTSGANTITFDIPTSDAGYNLSNGGTNVWSISFGLLPVLTDNGTTIDGASQTVNRGNTNAAGPEIRIEGGVSNALSIQASDCVIKSLILQGTSPSNGSPVTDAIVLIGGNVSGGGFATNNRIESCYIGTNPTGTGAAPTRGAHGIGLKSASQTTIGGATTDKRNIISGNLTTGIVLDGSFATTVANNYIGTNAAGDAAFTSARQGTGVSVWGGSLGNSIGIVGAGNVISGNSTGVGIGLVSGSGSMSGVSTNIVRANLIGLNAAGTAALGNSSEGVSMSNISSGQFGTSSGNTIGGSGAGEGNVISGNGLGITSFALSGTVIQGNKIGTDATGNFAFGNGGNGITVSLMSTSGGFGGGSYHTLIGEDAGTASTSVAGAGNLIAHNSGSGVALMSPPPMFGTALGTPIIIRRNSIYSNAGLGISLNLGSGTPNDIGDTDSGANNLQNYPVISGVVAVTGGVTVSGTLNSTPSKQFALDFYSNPNGNEGRTWIGSTTVNTDANGDASFSVTLTPVGGVANGFITATATRLSGNDGTTGAQGDTSEFSATVSATGATASGLIISEFRFRGTASRDQYVELYNTTNAPLNISGWFIRTDTGGGITQPSVVPAGTVVPAYGHFLFTGTGYSLTAYGASDASIGAIAADDSGVALFNAAGAVQDAAGFNTSLATLREGAGLASAPSTNGTASSQHAFMRRFKGQLPVDTGDNAADFLLLTTDGAAVTGTSITPQLGAPNPEGLNSPNNINAQIGVRVLDANFGPNAAPNRIRVGSGNSGSLVFRRIIKNNTTQPLSRIRLLITDITGQVSPVVAGQADVRLTSQADENVAVAGQGTVLVYGTTLEAPSIAPSGTGPTTVGGGGIGSSVNYDIVLTTPLAAGDERPYTFNVQVAKTGSFFVNINLLGK